MSDVRNMPVMKAKCATCPFGPDGDPHVQANVVSRLLTGSQECHSTGHPVYGTQATHLCRGARDWQLTILHRMGLLTEPTDEAFAAKAKELGITR